MLSLKENMDAKDIREIYSIPGAEFCDIGEYYAQYSQGIQQENLPGFNKWFMCRIKKIIDGRFMSMNNSLQDNLIIDQAIHMVSVNIARTRAESSILVTVHGPSSELMNSRLILNGEILHGVPDGNRGVTFNFEHHSKESIPEWFIIVFEVKLGASPIVTVSVTSDGTVSSKLGSSLHKTKLPTDWIGIKS